MSVIVNTTEQSIVVSGGSGSIVVKSPQVTNIVTTEPARPSIIISDSEGQSAVVTVPQTQIVNIVAPGPQGPPGPDGGALPVGGNPGDLLMKEDYANGAAGWAPTLDGGTFF